MAPRPLLTDAQRGRRVTPAPRSERTTPRGPQRFVAAKRALLAASTAFVTVNLWTGCPLLALWVGSQVVGKQRLSMGAVGITVMTLAVLVFAFAVALTWLNNTYDELTGRPRIERRATWLRSMRAEDEGHVSQRAGITALERIIMINVYVAVIAFLGWFFVIAGSPLPH